MESGPVRSVLTSPRSDFAARIAGRQPRPGSRSPNPECSEPPGAPNISGIGDTSTRARRRSRCSGRRAVAVHLDPPHASPRNVIPVTIAEMDIHGTTVRIRGADQPDGSTGLAADITAAAAADLDLEPGQDVYFVVKAQEVELHPALPPAG